MKTVNTRDGMVVLHFCTLYFFPLIETDSIYYERLSNDQDASNSLDDAMYLENTFKWMKKVSPVGERVGFL